VLGQAEQRAGDPLRHPLGREVLGHR
jgi:hypothetical protein